MRLRLYEELTNRQPRPFDWRFTKYDLFDWLQRQSAKIRPVNTGATETDA